MDQNIDDLPALLSDAAFIERTVTSVAFMDWYFDLALNGTHLSREQAARTFLQHYPRHIMDLRHPPLPPGPPPNPNLLELWQSFINSDWLRNNEHEPKIAGFSVLRQMLVQQSDPTDAQTLWTCVVPSPSQPNVVCGQAFRRWDRAITHIRARHLNHKPFTCGGRCGVTTCDRRFTSQENAHQHCE